MKRNSSFSHNSSNIHDERDEEQDAAFKGMNVNMKVRICDRIQPGRQHSTYELAKQPSITCK